MDEKKYNLSFTETELFMLQEIFSKLYLWSEYVKDGNYETKNLTFTFSQYEYSKMTRILNLIRRSK